jgi:hypothetical protein
MNGLLIESYPAVMKNNARNPAFLMGIMMDNDDLPMDLGKQ